MSSRSKKLVFIAFLTMFLSIMMVLQASAVGPLKSQSSNRFETSISHSGTTASVSANVKVASSIEKVSIKIELQKKDGAAYKTIKTWSSTTSSSYASMRKTAVVSSKATYRVKTTFTLYNTSGRETITKTAY